MTTASFDLDSLLELGTCLVVIDRADVIEWMSPCLKRLLGTAELGGTLTTLECPSDRPMVALALLRGDGKTLPLRGAWLDRCEGGRVFVGSPVPESDDEMESLGLTPEDFLPADPWVRYLTRTDEAAATHAEATRRIDDLKSQRDSFETAHDEMRDARRTALKMLQDINIERRRADTALRELETTQVDLIQASRHAGMAEVANGVLHNVGNILNSVNVSATVVSDKVRRSKTARLTQVVDLLLENASDLGTFVTSDEKGRLIPSYLQKLAHILTEENEVVLKELSGLVDNVEHIKQIINMQQSYAGLSGLNERLVLCELVEDALKINLAGLRRHGVKVIREFGDLPPVMVDRHKVLQILVNLLSNAKYALKHNDLGEKTVRIQIEKQSDAMAVIRVVDNGEGLPAENITRVFAHGFTTKKEGHGFGLHSSALAAKELGGALIASSEGPGRGRPSPWSCPSRQRRRGHECD